MAGLLSTVLPAFSRTNPVSDDIGSPTWWMYRLAHKLHREQVDSVETMVDGVSIIRTGMGRLKRYDDGAFDLPWVSDPDVKAEFLAFVDRSRSNFMRLVVNAEAERIAVLGLRLPDDNETADSETWNIWLRNGMDARAPVVFRDALLLRRSFMSVWWGPDGQARIAAEDALRSTVEYEPGRPGTVAAGITTWIDEWTAENHAQLFLPTGVHHFRFGPHPADRRAPAGWYEISTEPNPLGECTLVPFVNQPDVHNYGVSEIEDVLPVQDRICQTLMNRQVAEHLSAFRQKWATGLDIPDDDDNEPVEPYQAALDKLWVSPDPESKFGQFDATDMSNYHKTDEKDLEHLSVMTRTPRHVFMHQGQAPSGDSMKSDEAGLVAKVSGTRAPFGSGTLKVLRLARRIDNLDTPLQSEVVWADPEWQTFAQLVDGWSKLVQTRIASMDLAREKLGMTPATIARVKREIVAEDLLNDALTPEAELEDAATVA